MDDNWDQPICLFLCGDVMTGRGIDQVLPFPVHPVLYETSVRDAHKYVQLAEALHGPIPRPASFEYIWGDALEEIRPLKTDGRIINMETSVTTSEEYWPNKHVLYRMCPENVGCITAAHIDSCCLANNHVLDWGYRGLDEALRTLDSAGVARTGAGRNAAEAAAPAVLDVAGKGRVLIFAFGSTTSGVPREWGATEFRPGVNLLEDLSEDNARRVAGRIRQAKRPGDVIVASIHWVATGVMRFRESRASRNRGGLGMMQLGVSFRSIRQTKETGYEDFGNRFGKDQERRLCV